MRAMREAATPSWLLPELRCGGHCALGAVLRLRRPFLEVKRGGQPPLAAAAFTSPRELPYLRVSDCLKDLLPEPEEPWEIVRVRDVARHHAVAWQSRSQVTTDPLDS